MSSIELHKIGEKIKYARRRENKTQQEIADASKISKSLLSKIENGQTASAIATLSRICDSLHIQLTWVLDDNEEQDIVVQKKRNRPQKVGDESMGYSYEILANRSQYSGIEPTIVHVTPKSLNLRDEKTYTHSQDEFIYILEGEIELLYDGKKQLLQTGDSAYFAGSKPHLFLPVDDQEAKVLTCFIDRV
ncbi:helix-turn-helix domain-containing protein [Oceanobacillus neutriphilus]|uniref:MerR family transcriptional regulator n=1 Tax=Oceanobacillus neutriphilus TaxID=531815 RepID=A0ABQ2NSK8_9BACI|nr:XRE family transcriptional regulator [Oceanobacillus neutriphilus]GGP09635.1 MerR family transcriptional regulator [Oceanobacillus neutriphilus]